MTSYLEALYARVNDLRYKIEADALRPNPTSTFSLFSDSPDMLLAKFAELEPQASRVWNMQTNWRFDPDDPSFELNDRSWGRGVDSLIVTTGRVLEMNPVMMAHCGHRVWVGPTLINMILINEVFVVVEGIRTPDGFVTTMCSGNSEVTQSVRTIFAASLALSSQPFPPGTVSLSRRQIEVARGIARGWSDTRLSRGLGVSRRTVEREIAAVLVFLQADNRSEAVSQMSGRNFKVTEVPRGSTVPPPVMA